MDIYEASRPFIPQPFEVLKALILVACVAIPLESIFPARKANKYSNKKSSEGLVNLAYWFLTPIFTRVVSNLVIFLIIFFLFQFSSLKFDTTILDGFGPLAKQSQYLQVLEILFLADFIEYWVHRKFHKRPFWKIHIVHHSPKVMNWLSSARVHPLNELITRICQVIPLMSLGFSAHGIILIVPYLFFYVIFVHSNLSWDFGPFRYFLVSPAYHQWHHTSDLEAIDKNFAGIFPIWDLIFGTSYFPNTLPREFGTTAKFFPDSFALQLLYPFKKNLQEKSKNNLAFNEIRELEK